MPLCMPVCMPHTRCPRCGVFLCVHTLSHSPSERDFTHLQTHTQRHRDTQTHTDNRVEQSSCRWGILNRKPDQHRPCCPVTKHIKSPRLACVLCREGKCVLYSQGKREKEIERERKREKERERERERPAAMRVTEGLKDAPGFVHFFVRGVTQDLDADATH